MKQTLRYGFCLLMFLGLGLNLSHAQVANFDNTWESFLKDPKTAQINEIDPPLKSDIKNYCKWALMMATSDFCAGDLQEAKKLVKELDAIPSTSYAGIMGFTERYQKLKVDIEGYYDVEGLWVGFKNNHIMDLDKLTKGDKGKRVCEKATLAKYTYMKIYSHYCDGDVASSKKEFEGRFTNLITKTSLEIKDVTGLPEEVTLMKKVFKGIDLLGPAWKEYMDTDVSPGFEYDMPIIDCYTIPNMKVYMLRAMVDVCKYGSEYLEKIQKLQETNTHKIPTDLSDKIDWLEKEVKRYNGNLANLNKAWKDFLPDDKVDGDIKFKGEYCEKDAQIKSYIMEGMMDICNKGEEMLEKIAKVQEEHNPKLDEATKGKLKKMKNLVEKEEENLAKLNERWGEFVKRDTLDKIDFEFVYCDKEAQIRAYIMDGRIHACTKGEARLEDIAKVMKEHSPSLQADTKEKLEALEALVTEYMTDLRNLDKLWKEFIANNDTIEHEFEVVPYYCDKIAQVKSWVLVGEVNTCEQGKEYLDKINAFTKKHSLKYDKQLQCRITRLHMHVWDCIYWELVRQAWAETHEERERFGPKSAGIMLEAIPDENCPPEVVYEPLGKIGIRYIVVTYLCQGTDLAKMGDPKYYQKIADWVDNSVLKEYCNMSTLRCKKDFTIYLEGHTDGHPFSYHKYKTKLGLPKGTEFTHFVGKSDTIKKKTERDLDYELKSNMELGLARAWTVKKQLDFMKVPIEIGAYEHPKNEKGGEYRRVDIELNMPNLLLDYFEKRLAILLEESGIGPRPKVCRD
jgi:hypothetical protein